MQPSTTDSTSDPPIPRTDPPVFTAEWNPALKPLLPVCESWPIFGPDTLLLPFSLFLFAIPGCPEWIATVLLIIGILAVLRRCLHAYIVGPIIFPSQNVAKDVPKCLINMLKSLGSDPALLGRQGINELRRRRETMLTAFPSATNVRVATPDGLILDVVHFLCANGDQSAPTCIYFNANMQLMEGASTHNTASMYMAAGINLVVFNYRGVCESTGRLTVPGTVIDGDAVFQYVHLHCGVPEQSILFHARSIGGGIAANVAGLHNNVRVCSDRSFGSLLHVIRLSVRKLCRVDPDPQASPNNSPDKSESTIEMELQSPRISRQPKEAPLSCMPMVKLQFVSKIRKCVAASLTALAWAIGWEIEAVSSWSQVNGPKWLFYHPHDLMIPNDASLHHAVEGLELALDDHTEHYRMSGETNAHNRAFNVSEKAWHISLAREALGLDAEMMLQPPSASISVQDAEWRVRPQPAQEEEECSPLSHQQDDSKLLSDRSNMA